eukprot:6249806-Pyramimonas_sp.AAC.1
MKNNSCDILQSTIPNTYIIPSINRERTSTGAFDIDADRLKGRTHAAAPARPGCPLSYAMHQPRFEKLHRYAIVVLTGCSSLLWTPGVRWAHAWRNIGAEISAGVRVELRQKHEAVNAARLLACNQEPFKNLDADAKVTFLEFMELVKEASEVDLTMHPFELV